MSFEVLESVLRPLSYWYNQDNIEEVAINRAGQVWLRLRGKRAYPWVMYKDEKLTKEYLTDLLYIVANTYEIPFDPVAGSPVVYASIPGEHRFSAICGKNVMYDEEDLTGGIALTIRVHSDDVAFGLGDYGLKQGEKLHQINPLKTIKDPEDPYERLANAIILQAVTDYRAALKQIKRNPKNRETIDEAMRVESFFRSGWYSQLTAVDGEYLIRRLQDEVRE